MRYVSFLFLLLFFMPSAHSVCSGDGSAWSWDNSESKSCAPCGYTAPLNDRQKLHDACGSSGNTSGYVGFRVIWDKQTAANEYSFELQVNDGSWFWFHTAWRDHSDRKEFAFSDHGINQGDSFCVRYRVADGSGNWSDYSPNTCTTVPSNSTGTSSNTLLRPEPPTVETY